VSAVDIESPDAWHPPNYAGFVHTEGSALTTTEAFIDALAQRKVRPLNPRATFMQHVGIPPATNRHFEEFIAKTPLDFMEGLHPIFAVPGDRNLGGAGPWFEAVIIPGVLMAFCYCPLPKKLRHQPANRDMTRLVKFLRNRGTS
jgi:hypothetical protein